MRDALGHFALPLPRPGSADASRAAASFRPALIVGLAYILLTILTEPFFMGDTIGYADAVAREEIKDFGHFGWYWIGYVVTHLLLPITSMFVGSSLALNVTLTFILLNLITGLMSVLVMRSLVHHITGHSGASYVAAFALLFAQSFLNFTQAGTPYTFGMAFLLLGIWIVVTKDDDGLTSSGATLAGASLFVAVAVWFTFVFAVPAALLASVLLRGLTRRRMITAIAVGLVFSTLLLLTFGAGGYSLGIRSIEGAREWIMGAGHGVRGMSGVPRAAFGFGRSFIDTGNDGPLLKAFLVGDPYNPVSLSDIVRASLLKLAVFYAFVAAILFNLVRSADGRRMLALLAITSAPVLAFAVMWQGAAIERYLPMYPVFFLAFGASLASTQAIWLLKQASLAFVAVMAVVNLGVMAKPVQAAREDAVIERMRDLAPRLRPGSMVAVISQMDEVWAFRWTFPFNPLNKSDNFSVYHLVEPGTTWTVNWREAFATQALATWDRGADVWVSTRVGMDRPLREWKWVEGVDPAVKWADVRDLFGQLESRTRVGGADGFFLLDPSPHHRAVLREVAARPGLNGPPAAVHSSASKAALSK
jgi:hypothetical protein